MSHPPPFQQHLPWRSKRAPVQHFDVYVDDEIAVAQGSTTKLNRLRRVLLHANDLIIRPNDKADESQGRREPVSKKKMRKGEACWSTKKVILGWLVDTLRGTVDLPAHRKLRLLEIVGSVCNKKRISVRQCQNLLGELRSMLLGVPGGKGLFSQLQAALVAQEGSRVRIHSQAKDQLKDW